MQDDHKILLSNSKVNQATRMIQTHATGRKEQEQEQEYDQEQEVSDGGGVKKEVRLVMPDENTDGRSSQLLEVEVSREMFMEMESRRSSRLQEVGLH